MHKRPLSLANLRTVPKQCSGVEQRLVRERSIDQRRPEACALSLCLVTVADAQGLSVYSEPAVWQRVSMTPAGWHQARPALSKRAWVAYHRPLSQVFALAGDAKRSTAACTPRAGDDESVDLKAVFARLWEVWS